ncbi:chaperonin 10-like protein, partial [Collybia nuda]
MIIPATAHEYFLTMVGSPDNLVIRVKTIEPSKANEVLVKVHAVSLQFRDLQVAVGKYPAIYSDHLVPCSDMAGEIVAIGTDVKDWKKGDRVCANLAADHLYGDSSYIIKESHLGCQSPGVLTEYRTFRSHVIFLIIPILDSLTYKKRCAALTAYNCLQGPVPLKAGDYVLILGTGGVPTKTPNWDEEKLKITTGLDCGCGTLAKSIKSVRLAGYLHIVGYVSDQGKADVDIVKISISKGITLRGIQIGSIAQFKDMTCLLSANPEMTRPFIDKIFSKRQIR